MLTIVVVVVVAAVVVVVVVAVVVIAVVVADLTLTLDSRGSWSHKGAGVLRRSVQYDMQLSLFRNLIASAQQDILCQVADMSSKPCVRWIGR